MSPARWNRVSVGRRRSVELENLDQLTGRPLLTSWGLKEDRQIQGQQIRTLYNIAIANPFTWSFRTMAGSLKAICSRACWGIGLSKPKVYFSKSRHELNGGKTSLAYLSSDASAFSGKASIRVRMRVSLSNLPSSECNNPLLPTRGKFVESEFSLIVGALGFSL